MCDCAEDASLEGPAYEDPLCAWLAYCCFDRALTKAIVERDKLDAFKNK